MRQSIKVVKDAENPESPEILAEAIVRIGAAMQKLTKSGLNEKAIVVLIQDDTNLPKRDIKLVLYSLRSLESRYCRK